MAFATCCFCAALASRDLIDARAGKNLLHPSPSERNGSAAAPVRASALMPRCVTSASVRRGQDLTPAALRPEAPGDLDRFGCLSVRVDENAARPDDDALSPSLDQFSLRSGPGDLARFLTVQCARSNDRSRSPYSKAYPAPTAPAKAGPATRSERAQQPSVKAELVTSIRASLPTFLVSPVRRDQPGGAFHV